MKKMAPTRKSNQNGSSLKLVKSVSKRIWLFPLSLEAERRYWNLHSKQNRNRENSDNCVAWRIRNCPPWVRLTSTMLLGRTWKRNMERPWLYRNNVSQKLCSHSGVLTVFSFVFTHLSGNDLLLKYIAKWYLRSCSFMKLERLFTKR